MGMDISQLEKELLKELKRKQLSPTEASLMLAQLRKPKTERHNTVDRHYGSRHFRIGIVSDTHYGHKMFRHDVHRDSVKIFKREGVEEVWHPGDIIEGMSNREGHIYELDDLGVSAQLKTAATRLSEYGKPILAILGNHDQWAMRKSNQGVNIGDYLTSHVPDFQCIGDMAGDVSVGPITLRMTHEGATAYALSYSLQKRINALGGGDKPNILLNGHLHKLIYMFYRNIHAIECGTLEDQTEFMAMKGTPAHVGFLTLDVWYNKGGVTKLQPTFYPYYD